MATVADLKIAVAAFMNREASAFVMHGRDNLLQACNNARLYAERTINFELSRVSITVPNVSLSNGGPLSGAVLYGTATSVSVKQLISAFVAFSTGQGQFPVPFISRDRHIANLRRIYEGARRTRIEDYPSLLTSKPIMVTQLGTTVYVIPNDPTMFNNATTISLYFDAFRWLPMYTATETDFLLDFCFDYLMYRAIFELNFFLKEDERVAITTSLMNESFLSMRAWNAAMIGQGTDCVDME